MAEKPPVRRFAELTVRGVVQGVGFRPFVARLARELQLSGSVRNESGDVVIEAIGEEAALLELEARLCQTPPSGSQIESLSVRYSPGKPPTQPTGFSIRASRKGPGGPAMPTPDIAVCDDCLRELLTPGDPRYHNPFISCTHCGPRYSILRELPYDRAATSMECFPLCPLCESQYRSPTDRRYHAQTVCCNACGPRLRYTDRDGGGLSGDEALEAAVKRLQNGEIVAVKGIGGYHFACDPFREETVSRLRTLKGREDKPFAVMFASLDEIRLHCRVSGEEERLLLSPERPIVLLARENSHIHPAVYGNSPYMGAFLPYTPLQQLIVTQTGPLVMTSSNATSLPIIRDDGEMARFFEAHGELSCVMSHDREILRRLDDSVAAVTAAGPQLLRRARGYVPLPIFAELPEGPPVLAFGGQEKSALCLSAGNRLYMGAELGSLDTREAVEALRENAEDFQRILGIRAEAAVCDLHPSYEATRLAERSGLPLLRVQHHFSHIASVMAEHGLTEPVLGAAFDGTGWGEDGTVWGGELLLTTPTGYERVGHLRPIPMLGCDESVRQGWKSALCLRLSAGLPPDPEDERGKLAAAALRTGVNALRSSSMGRVFDAVSSLLGICHTSGYEGQCAVELEAAAHRFGRTRGEKAPAPFSYGLTEANGPLELDFAPCVRELDGLARSGQSPEELAWRFHLTVSRMLLDAMRRLSKRHGVRTVALSGGVFQNRLLLSMTLPALRQAGLTVYTNEKVPPGDGGLALGQAYIARHSMRR